MKSEWQTKKIGEVVDIRRGSSPRPIHKFLASEGMPWVKIADATSDTSRYIWRTNEFIIDEGVNKSVKVVPETLIVSNSATPGLPKIMKITACVHDGWLVFFNYRGITRDFLYYKFVDIRHKLVNQANGSVFQNLKTDIVRDFDIDVPSIETQQKIVGILSNIDEKIELNNAINNNLEQQARALYKSWFIDFEPFGGVMPIDWRTGQLKDILKLKRNSIKAGQNTELPYLPIDVIPMKTFAISEFKLNKEAKSSLVTFSKNDIIIGAMRVYFHRVVLAPCDGITRTTCFTLVPHNPEYLSYCLLCCDLDSSIEYAQTTSKGSTMPYAIWDGGLGDMEISIPSLKVAKEFNDVILPMLEKIQSSYYENTYLKELRDSLLSKLMSGDIDVSRVEI